MAGGVGAEHRSPRVPGETCRDQSARRKIRSWAPACLGRQRRRRTADASVDSERPVDGERPFVSPYEGMNRCGRARCRCAGSWGYFEAPCGTRRRNSAATRPPSDRSHRAASSMAAPTGSVLAPSFVPTQGAAWPVPVLRSFRRMPMTPTVPRSPGHHQTRRDGRRQVPSPSYGEPRNAPWTANVLWTAPGPTRRPPGFCHEVVVRHGVSDIVTTSTSQRSLWHRPELEPG
jgi:hypothetical protein